MSRPVNLCINTSIIFLLPPSLHISILYLILSVPEATETIGLSSLAPTSANSLLNARVFPYGTICLGKFVLLSVWLSSNASFLHIPLLISCNCVLPILFLSVLSISLCCLSLLSKRCLHWQVLPYARLFFLFLVVYFFFFYFLITVFYL